MSRPVAATTTARGVIIIVTLAPWARTSAWWRHAVRSLQGRDAPLSWTLFMHYVIKGHGGDSAALTAGEADIIRGWASSLAGWRERGQRGQYPLRFHHYQSEPPASGASAPATFAD